MTQAPDSPPSSSAPSDPGAVVTYKWVTTGSDLPPSASSNLYSITASWTLAAAAVTRGYIQLIGYDDAAHPYPQDKGHFAHPEEIIAFNLIATDAADASRVFRFDKSDTGIQFSLPYAWSEAYGSNLRITADGPVADIHLQKPGGGVAAPKFSLYSSTEISVEEGGSSYVLNGRWQRS